MPSKAILIQQVYSGSQYTEALALTFGRNIEYCKRWGFDYLTMYGNVVDKWDVKYGGWAKLQMILSSLEQGFEHVVWLDADALIADLNTDLRCGCPEFGIGMVVHSPKVQPTWNVGAMYVTNSPDIQAFIKEWIRWFPGPLNGWHENAMINLLSLVPAFSAYVSEIEPKWNSCEKGFTHVDDAVVEGFHGAGSVEVRIQLMKDWLGKENYASE